MANLFTGQTPTVTNADDGAPGIATATSVTFAQSGTVTGVRFYATTTVSGTYTVQLYQPTAADDISPAGTLLASKVAGGAPTPGTWNTILFDTPVTVTTSTLYRAVLHSSAGRYVATLEFFGVPLTNGDITAESNGNNPTGLGTLRQGTFAISATPTYPSGAGNRTCYFVDVEFTAGAAPATVTPDSVSLKTNVGQPSIGVAALAPASIRLAAAVGQPAVTTPAPEPGEVQPSGWGGLLSVRKSADADHRANVERDRHPVDCPEHGWPLKPTPRGLHCEFGGHVVTPRSI